MAQTTTALAAAGRSVIEHADGVYLGLAEEAYHADPALGSSALKTIGHSPPQWWWTSPYNMIEPQPRKADEPFQRLGKAVHVALLEGWDVYERCYGILPTKEDFPHALDTIPQLQAELRLRRAPISGTKPELIQRLQDIDPGIEILEIIQREWRLTNRVREISAAEARRVELLHRMAMASPEEFALPGGEVSTLRGAFTGGLSEVSVFWTDENGIRQRARFDKLKPRVTLDLKTFSSWNESFDFDTGLMREAKHRGYQLQAAHYEEARRWLRDLVRVGKVFGGTEEQHALLEEVAESDVWTWMWAFAITVGTPLMKGLRYNLDGVQAGKWAQKREDALGKFLFYRETFGGFDQMWFDPVAIITPDDDAWEMA